MEPDSPEWRAKWSVPGRAVDRVDKRKQQRLQGVDLDPSSLEKAYRRLGPKTWGALAMGRYEQRARQVERHRELLPQSAWGVLASIPALDALLSRFGATWSLAPDLTGRSTWPNQLQWGADQAVEAFRHLRAGRQMASFALARQQLERWTLNVATHHGMEPGPDEGMIEFARRAWSVYPDVPLDMGHAWSRLSECLHGRGEAVGVASWEHMAGHMRTHSIETPQETLTASETVCDVLDATLRQVRGGASVLASEQGRDDWASWMQRSFSIRLKADVPNVGTCVMAPMDYQAMYGLAADHLLREGEDYRRMVASPDRAWRMVHAQSEMTVFGPLIERRARVIRRARVAMGQERQLLGEDFDAGHLMARLFRYIAIAEAADIVSLWCQGEEAMSLRAAAASLRSAWCLWLEDTDASMICTRGVLEQACRARTWRLKPGRAQRIDGAHAHATPGRWIAESGWRRASILGRALGEYSHISVRSRWSGARRALEELHPESGDEQAARHMARGNALDSTAYLLAHELLARLDAASGVLADGFRREVTLMDAEAHDRSVQELLERSHALREFDFGDADLRPVSEAAQVKSPTP
jgi:hypothetical protein